MTEWQVTAFAKAEAIALDIVAREPGGTVVIADPANQEITITISLDGSSEPIFVSDASHVSLTSAPEGRYQMVLSAADLTDLAEGKLYQFDIWSKAAGSDHIRQARGVIVLGASGAPAVWNT